MFIPFPVIANDFWKLFFILRSNIIVSSCYMIMILCYFMLMAGCACGGCIFNLLLLLLVPGNVVAVPLSTVLVFKVQSMITPLIPSFELCVFQIFWIANDYGWFTFDASLKSLLTLGPNELTFLLELTLHWLDKTINILYILRSWKQIMKLLPGN